MTRWPRIVRYCFTEGVPTRSLGVALIVGTVLNLINQGDALFGPHPVQLPKLLLRFAVPYFVATCGAVSYRIRSERDRRAASTAS
jgi:hypothetical protein